MPALSPAGGPALLPVRLRPGLQRSSTTRRPLGRRIRGFGSVLQSRSFWARKGLGQWGVTHSL